MKTDREIAEQLGIEPTQEWLKRHGLDPKSRRRNDLLFGVVAVAWFLLGVGVGVPIGVLWL